MSTEAIPSLEDWFSRGFYLTSDAWPYGHSQFSVNWPFYSQMTIIGQDEQVKSYIEDRFAVLLKDNWPSRHMKSAFGSNVLLSSAELAQVVGVDFDTVNNWIRRGIISRSPIGGRQLRNRLFSVEEVFKTALKNELVKLGIQPSSASDAVNELWGKWAENEIQENTCAILARKNGKWICLVCRRNSSTGHFYKSQSPSTGKVERAELPQQTFAVIPIHNVYSQVTESLSTLLKGTNLG